MSCLLLVVDNAPWHKTKAIRMWLEEIKDLIEVHFLPKYAPKLNAAVYIWKETQKWASHNQFFGPLKDLKDSLFRRFNRFQGNPGTLKTLVPHLRRRPTQCRLVYLAVGGPFSLDRSHLQRRLDEKGVSVAWPHLMRDLARVQSVLVELEGIRYQLRTTMQDASLHAFHAAGVRPRTSITQLSHNS